MTVVRMHVMTRCRYAWTGLLVLSFGTPRRKNIYPPVIHGPHPRTRASKEKAVDVLQTTPGPAATPRSPSLEERIPLVGDLERTPAHNSGCLIHGTNSSTARDERLDSAESPSTARIPARARPRTPAGVERNPAGVHAGAPRGSLGGPGARRARARASVYVRGCGRPGRGSRSRPLGPGLVLPASTAPHARVRTCPGGRWTCGRPAPCARAEPSSCVLRPASCVLHPASARPVRSIRGRVRSSRAIESCAVLPAGAFHAGGARGGVRGRVWAARRGEGHRMERAREGSGGPRGHDVPFPARDARTPVDAVRGVRRVCARTCAAASLRHGRRPTPRRSR